MKIEYWSTYILVCILNIISFLFFAYDLILVQGKNKEYLLKLQKEAVIMYSINELFEVVETKAVYAETEKLFSNQLYSIVLTEEGECIYFK